MIKRVMYTVLAASLLGGTSTVAALASQISSTPLHVAYGVHDRDGDGNKRDQSGDKGDKGDKGDRGDKGDQRDHGKQPPAA